jgi:hypothetical protein
LAIEHAHRHGFLRVARGRPARQGQPDCRECP